jgi:hypothetical protein
VRDARRVINEVFLDAHRRCWHVLHDFYSHELIMAVHEYIDDSTLQLQVRDRAIDCAYKVDKHG